MKKFEYLFIVIVTDASGAEEKIAKKLNKLGEEGWEVINFIESRVILFSALLKREKGN